jgi:hypothetical protein
MAQSKQKWPSDEEQKTIGYIVHEIKMGDVEDPDLFVAQPIYDWQQTKAGKYIMKNSAPSPMWNRTVDINTYGHLYTIIAYLTPKQLTYYKLRFE